MVRSVLAVVLGVVLGGATISAVELIGNRLYPLPEGIDPNNLEALRASIPDFPDVPLGWKLMELVAWAFGSAVGGFVAASIARRSPVVHAAAVGAFFWTAAAMNMLGGRHPLWLGLVGVAISLPLPAAYAGAKLALLRRARAVPGLY